MCCNRLPIAKINQVGVFPAEEILCLFLKSCIEFYNILNRFIVILDCTRNCIKNRFVFLRPLAFSPLAKVINGTKIVICDDKPGFLSIF